MIILAAHHPRPINGFARSPIQNPKWKSVSCLIGPLRYGICTLTIPEPGIFSAGRHRWGLRQDSNTQWRGSETILLSPSVPCRSRCRSPELTRFYSPKLTHPPSTLRMESTRLTGATRKGRIMRPLDQFT